MQPVKNYSEDNVTLLITHESGGISLGRKDHCAGCINLQIQNEPGNPGSENITPINNCDIKFDLTSWTLGDENGNVYTFPEHIIDHVGFVDVHAGIGNDTGFRLFQCSQEPCALWSPGSITLRDWQNNICTYNEIQQ
jgi:hypothetical protein